jgi:hypothetical protein
MSTEDKSLAAAKKALTIVYKKSMDWDKSARGLRDTLLQHTTLRSIRKTFLDLEKANRKREADALEASLPIKKLVRIRLYISESSPGQMRVQ